jgi:periplasmic divalent cation tolerance protein
MVYVTAASVDEAHAIGRAVVEKGLAACANILPSMRSVYWWQGELCESDEAVLILKTTSAMMERLTAAVTSLHSYECPCVVALPIAAGNPAYLRWIAESVMEAQV